MERILLVEDDAALARGIALALDAHERTVTAAQTAAEARRAVAAERFDLVLLDINLPDASGLDLLRDWRANGDQTPVILLTANDMEMDEVVGLEAGANDYITKPFSLAVLRARVAVQLRTQRAQEEAVRIGPFHFDFARMVSAARARRWSFRKQSSGFCACSSKTAATLSADRISSIVYGARKRRSSKKMPSR